MPSIAHLARILSLLIVLRGALAGPIVVPNTPCPEDAAKNAAKNAISSSTSKLATNNLIVNAKNADNAGKKATDTTKGASIPDFFGFTGPANPSSAGDNKVDAKGKANQGNTNADGSAAVQKSSLTDPKNAGAASGQLNGGNPIADKFTPSIATPNGTPSKVDAIGNKKQGVTDAQKNANGADDNKFLFSATADDRIPADSNNAALSQTGKASKGESSFRPLTDDSNKIGAKGDANANRFGTEGSGSKVGTQGNTVGVTAPKAGEQSSEKVAAASESISGNRKPSTGDVSLSSTNPPNTSSDRTAADTTIPLDNATKGAAGKAKGAQGSIVNQPGAAAPKVGEQAKSDTKVAEVDSAAGQRLSSAQGNNAAGPSLSFLNGDTKVGNIEGSQSNVFGSNNKEAGKANAGKKSDDC